MDFIYRNAAPCYKGSETRASQASTGPRPGFWCGLVGGARPPYRKAGSAGGVMQPVPRSWWHWMSVTPQYKAAPVFQPQEPEPPPAGCSKPEPEAAYWREDWRREDDDVDIALREIRIY
jgi:hypothetical protein